MVMRFGGLFEGFELEEREDEVDGVTDFFWDELVGC